MIVAGTEAAFDTIAHAHRLREAGVAEAIALGVRMGAVFLRLDGLVQPAGESVISIQVRNRPSWLL